MRNQRFIATHRGGSLHKEQHFELIRWAHICVEHVLPLCPEPIDPRLIHALHIALEWTQGTASVGDARNASLAAIAVARESSHPVVIALARAVGHAVATAHMADHTLRAAEYALKVVKNAGQSLEAERKWQDAQLAIGIAELVLSSRANS